MASGHSYGDQATPEQLQQVLADPQVIARLKQAYQLDEGYDIPYLGGYSQDGRTIYIDRHLPKALVVSGRKADVRPFLEIHEHTEKSLIDALRLPYVGKPGAHQLANAAEHDAVQRANLSPEAYEAALRPFIKADEHEKLERIPPDLDLTPYRGDKRLLTHLQGAMASARVRPDRSEPSIQDDSQGSESSSAVAGKSGRSGTPSSITS